MEQKVTYKNNMSSIRKSNKMTQNEVAEKLGIGRSYYSMLENNSREPKLELALQFAKIFKVKIEEVYSL